MRDFRGGHLECSAIAFNQGDIYALCGKLPRDSLADATVAASDDGGPIPELQIQRLISSHQQCLWTLQLPNFGYLKAPYIDMPADTPATSASSAASSASIQPRGMPRVMKIMRVCRSPDGQPDSHVGG
jgi:hypothetical protein